MYFRFERECHVANGTIYKGKRSWNYFEPDLQEGQIMLRDLLTQKCVDNFFFQNVI
jgi:hypothetical protein